MGGYVEMRFRGDQQKLFDLARHNGIKFVDIAEYLGVTKQALFRYSSLQRELDEGRFQAIHDYLKSIINGRRKNQSA